MAAPVAPGTIDVDPLEVDSALGSDDISTYTQSLRSSILEGVNENGRTYHKYSSDANYLMPEDEAEQDRLDLQHEIFLRTFDGKLTLTPVDDSVQHVLDLGTGTGAWAIDFADQHPHAQVLGIDLSPIQPTMVPSNCKFLVDNFEEEWVFEQQFDIIHGRMLTGSMAEPLEIFKKAFNQLKPGGWMEMDDVMLWKSDDDTMKPDSGYQRWCDLHREFAAKMGRNWDWPMKYKEWMEEAGFEDVVHLDFKWPINTWPKDKKMKELGRIQMVNALAALEGLSLRPFIEGLGMPREEVEGLLVQVRKEMQDPKLHVYWPIPVVYGRKPKSAAPAEP